MGMPERKKGYPNGVSYSDPATVKKYARPNWVLFFN